MEVVLGAVLGAALTVSALALVRLVRAPRRVLAPHEEATRIALHAAAATLPHLRRGLSAETAGRAVPHLRALTGADAVALADTRTVLAADGDVPGAEPGAALPGALQPSPDGRVRVEPSVGAIVAPLRIGETTVGALCAFRTEAERLEPEDVRVLAEAAQLVSAQIELSAVAEQEERVAAAELRALRAQISPHFIYNALAAVASYIRSRPEEARELLTEFAEFIRYAFRSERPYVTLADELHYVEKYLRLEQARFGERLVVRVQVAPEVLGAVVPALSLQPIVENAVRHGVESRAGVGHVAITGRDDGPDVEICVRDDGEGIAPEQARAALAGAAGGIGLSNVHARLRQTFGEAYGLTVAPEDGGGTRVTMTVPKFHAGVRAA